MRETVEGITGTVEDAPLKNYDIFRYRYNNVYLGVKK